MNTLLITSVFPPQSGGSGRWFWEVYRRLPLGDYRIVAGAQPEDESFDRTHDLPLTRLSLTWPTWGMFTRAGLPAYLRSVRAILPILRQHRVEALHCGALLPDGWIGWLLHKWTGIPYLCYMHGEERCYTNTSRELHWMAVRVLRNAQNVVANSANTARILREEWCLPAERINVLNPGVDAERFCPRAPNLEVRKSLGWHGRRVVLTVGRLQKRKGHDVLLRSLLSIKTAIPNVLYAIVGDGEEANALKRIVEKLDLGENVIFHGAIADEDLIQAYQQCDLFVLPNRAIGDDIEGFGMVLVEAQACGKPVVAGNSGGTAETMLPGATGFLIDCREPAPLADQIIELLRNDHLRGELGRRARQHAVEKFDWVSLQQRAQRIFTGSLEPPKIEYAASQV